MRIRNLVTIIFFFEFFIFCLRLVHFPLLVSLNISKEEELSENAKDLPVLCDKVLEGFKEKDTVKNAWCDIARAF